MSFLVQCTSFSGQKGTRIKTSSFFMKANLRPNEVGDCPGNIENCEYRKQRNDAFIGYTFDGIR